MKKATRTSWANVRSVEREIRTLKDLATRLGGSNVEFVASRYGQSPTNFEWTIQAYFPVSGKSYRYAYSGAMDLIAKWEARLAERA